MGELNNKELLPNGCKPKNILFNGELNNSKKEKLDVFVDLEYEEFDYSNIKCKLLYGNHEYRKFEKYLENSDGLNVTGKISNTESIFINITYWKRIKGNVAEVEVDYFIRGYKGLIPFANGKYFAYIVLDDVPAVHVDSPGELSYLGSISSERKDKDAISWEREFGKLSLADYYDYEKAEISNGKVITQIRRTKICVENQFYLKIDQDELVNNIEDELTDVIDLLSFISRKPIKWYEIKLTIYSEGEDRFVVYFEKRKKDYSRKKIIKNQLFHQSDLKKNLFCQLLEEYKKSPYKEQVKRVIHFIATSNIDEFPEPSFQSAFSALEIITTVCSEKLKINDLFGVGQEVRLKVILKEIKELIKKIYKRENWETDKSLSEINEKINELKRRPFINKLIETIQLSKIEIIDVWDFPKDVDFYDKLKNINKRRNDNIHSGKITDYHQLYRDRIRIQALVERLLLFILNHTGTKEFFISSYNELHGIHELP